MLSGLTKMTTGNLHPFPILFHSIATASFLVQKTFMLATFIIDLWYQSSMRSLPIWSTIDFFITNPMNCDGSPRTQRREFGFMESYSLRMHLSKLIDNCKTSHLSLDVICQESSLGWCSGQIQCNFYPSEMQSFGHCTFTSAMSPSTIAVSWPTTSAHMWLIFRLFVYHVCNSRHSTDIASQLPDNFKDFATRNAGGKCPSDAFFAHCHCELFHEQWKVLLNDKLIDAYKHGIILICCDEIKRWFYPQIFTYSTDYPEKWVMDSCKFYLGELMWSVRILIACLRNLRTCLCPHCLIPKDHIQNLATRQDFLQQKILTHTDTTELWSKVKEACKLIYEKNYAVDTVQVKALLKPESLVPTSEGWSICFASTGLSVISEHVLQETQTHWVWFF